MRVSIRRVKLTQKNRDILQALDRICFDSDYPYNFTKSQLEYWWIAYDGKKPIGFAGFRIKDKTAIFQRAGVLESYRNNGIHKKFINLRIKYARLLNLTEIITYTSVDNKNSFNNLVRRGFNLYKWKEEAGGQAEKITIFLWFKLEI